MLDAIAEAVGPDEDWQAQRPSSVAKGEEAGGPEVVGRTAPQLDCGTTMKQAKGAEARADGVARVAQVGVEESWLVHLATAWDLHAKTRATRIGVIRWATRVSVSMTTGGRDSMLWRTVDARGNAELDGLGGGVPIDMVVGSFLRGDRSEGRTEGAGEIGTIIEREAISRQGCTE